MQKFNCKQVSLVLVLLGIDAYAWLEYGTGGGILFFVIAGIMLWIFFNGLSTQDHADWENAVIDDINYQDGFEGDCFYDPMYAALPQNVYYKD
jgi:hypothetical protein